MIYKVNVLTAWEKFMHVYIHNDVLVVVINTHNN